MAPATGACRVGASPGLCPKRSGPVACRVASGSGSTRRSTVGAGRARAYRLRRMMQASAAPMKYAAPISSSVCTNSGTITQPPAPRPRIAQGAALVSPIAGRSSSGCRTPSQSPGRSRTQPRATTTTCKRDSPFAPSPAVRAAARPISAERRILCAGSLPCSRRCHWARLAGSHRSRPAAAASNSTPALTRYATTDCARLTDSC